MPDGTTIGYEVTALAGGHDGGTAPTSLQVRHTALAFPQAPRVTGRTLALAVSWTAPPSGGVTVTTYRVRYRPDGG